jgi:hypothetical protein
MAITASCHNELKPVQYIEVPLYVPSLFCMVAHNLTGRSQLPFVHSPFSIFHFCMYAQITLMEESSMSFFPQLHLTEAVKRRLFFCALKKSQNSRCYSFAFVLFAAGYEVLGYVRFLSKVNVHVRS